jgi:hypothetical protein
MSEFDARQVRAQSSDLIQSAAPDRAAPQPMHAASQEVGNQAAQRFAQSCPLRLPSPALCPFGGICHACPLRPQAKLTVTEPGDRYEQEADHVAEQVMQMPKPRMQRQGREPEEPIHAKPLADQITPLVQRQVEPEEEEEEEPIQAKLDEGTQIQRQEEEPEEEEEEPIQTKAAGGQAPPVDADMEARIRSLRGRGQPLPESERSFFEPRFGHDFSRVRVHTGSQAGEIARDAGARAFTFGRDIVLGPGQYAPGTNSGRHLLAHELTHTIQQRAAAAHEGRPGRPGISSLPAGGEHLNRSPGDEFEESELQAYLQHLTRTGSTEGNLDSDNKARAVVNAWRLGGSRYVLDARRKILMIREMQEGFTGNEDEQAILEILERSYNFELSVIFGSGGISPSSLNSDFHGTEWRRLQAFYARRFEGGMAAVLGGTITPQGYPVPLGLDIEQAAGSVYDISNLASIMMELPGAQPSWNEACVLGILCTRDQPVVSQLRSLNVKRIDRIEVTGWSFHGSQWTSRTLHPNGLNDQDQDLIGILTRRPSGSEVDCDDAAEVLIHEARHQNQPAGWLRYQREIDAYTYDEEWAIEHGVPPSGGSSHRTTDPTTGEQVPDPTVIEQHVRRIYGGPTPGTPGETVTGHQPPATSEVENPDGSTDTRPSRPGDTYIDDSTLILTGEQPIPSSTWTCPQ